MFLSEVREIVDICNRMRTCKEVSSASGGEGLSASTVSCVDFLQLMAEELQCDLISRKFSAINVATAISFISRMLQERLEYDDGMDPYDKLVYFIRHSFSEALFTSCLDDCSKAVPPASVETDVVSAARPASLRDLLENVREQLYTLQNKCVSDFENWLDGNLKMVLLYLCMARVRIRNSASISEEYDQKHVSWKLTTQNVSDFYNELVARGIATVLEVASVVYHLAFHDIYCRALVQTAMDMIGPAKEHVLRSWAQKNLLAYMQDHPMAVVEYLDERERLTMGSVLRVRMCLKSPDVLDDLDVREVVEYLMQTQRPGREDLDKVLEYVSNVRASDWKDEHVQKAVFMLDAKTLSVDESDLMKYLGDIEQPNKESVMDYVAGSLHPEHMDVMDIIHYLDDPMVGARAREIVHRLEEQELFLTRVVSPTWLMARCCFRFQMVTRELESDDIRGVKGHSKVVFEYRQEKQEDQDGHQQEQGAWYIHYSICIGDTYQHVERRVEDRFTKALTDISVNCCDDDGFVNTARDSVFAARIYFSYLEVFGSRTAAEIDLVCPAMYDSHSHEVVVKMFLISYIRGLLHRSLGVMLTTHFTEDEGVVWKYDAAFSASMRDTLRKGDHVIDYEWRKFDEGGKPIFYCAQVLGENRRGGRERLSFLFRPANDGRPVCLEMQWVEAALAVGVGHRGALIAVRSVPAPEGGSAGMPITPSAPGELGGGERPGNSADDDQRGKVVCGCRWGCHPQ